MPKEADPSCLAALRSIFADPASDVPQWTRTARTGGFRPDEGYDHLLSDTLVNKVQAIKEAIVRSLESGEKPTREEASGDVEMKLDPATFYHFRVSVEGVRLFVKVCFEDDARAATALVISVKRAY